MRPGDERAIVELFQAEDIAHRGLTDFTEEDLRERMLANPTVDVERDILLVEEEGRLIAVGCCTGRGAFAVVAPDHEDPALRAEVIAWTERRQSEKGRSPYRLAAFAANAPATAAIRAAGYTLERVYTKMVREFSQTGEPEAPDLAEGYVIRRVDRDVDGHALHALNERAFAEREDHESEEVEEYVSSILGLSQYAPAWSLIAEAADGAFAGSLIGWRPPDHPHGYVAVLAVDPGHRRVGLGRALLLEAFAAIHAAELPTAELYVASSDNDKALALYESVGMHQTERAEQYIRTP